ncbi:PP2C family protein-serine/threonine phosphatase [Anaeromyxobacter paludicola]|uniref:Serine/threonine protein phosphatase n=1 Tax=Anaeromyxobacter paludicola TaxID=2918171 RepID=A0ABN6NBR2_9BACT|nr:protein phosphatase 2C domain-containing protein [Anaeromyxobacter paludicola]BDG10669.1 serine/threonine protein phosphatase [Anaeromyxobacter paludicola]
MNDFELDHASLTDVGTGRDHNEDACVSSAEGEGQAVAAVADGVSQAAGGEVASEMAVEVLLRAFREEGGSPGQRLYRAFQQANIEIYDRAVAVPELRGMTTTLTALVVDRGELTAVHAGDSRLYLVRGGQVVQLTKDHTVAAEKVRYGLLSRERARNHPDRSVLTRSVGRELIVSRDRITQRLQQGDLLLACSDGLHGVLEDGELAELCDGSAAEACRRLLETANRRGTPDNLSAAVIRLVGPVPDDAAEPGQGGLKARLRRIFGGG